MKVEELLEKLKDPLINSVFPYTQEPCSNAVIENISEEFNKKFHFELPIIYKIIMRKVNGLNNNKLIIWPITSGELFDKDIFQTNKELSHTFSQEFIYFGKIKEELYVYSFKSKLYCSIDYLTKDIERVFVNSEEMFEFMLNEAF